MGLGHLVIAGLVVPQRVLKRQCNWRSSRPAGTGRRQSQAQAPWCEDALTATKFHVFATGIAQRIGKHPLELVDDHVKLSVIHLSPLALFPQQHAPLEFRMDRNKSL
jgi:hypothetical protein